MKRDSLYHLLLPGLLVLLAPLMLPALSAKQEAFGFDLGSRQARELITRLTATSIEHSSKVNLQEVDSTEQDEQVLDSRDMELQQNFPNPVIGSTTICFSIKNAGILTLRLSDMKGREIARLVDGFVSAGHHSVIFEAHFLTAGTYRYQLQMGRAMLTRLLQVTR